MDARQGRGRRQLVRVDLRAVDGSGILDTAGMIGAGRGLAWMDVVP